MNPELDFLDLESVLLLSNRVNSVNPPMTVYPSMIQLFNSPHYSTSFENIGLAKKFVL